ncbi:MAG: hypothetical protein IJW20_03205 [Clostridia bacterium]|nr:hypothetical protein [Clostridia bacterium]
MRKYLLILVLVITCLLCFLLMNFGFTIIPSYKEVNISSTEKKQVLAGLNTKNSTEFLAKKTSLNSAVQEYKNKKAQYDTLVQEGKITEATVNSMELYDVDFLWTTIGNYATQKGVTLQFDVSKSATKTSILPEYVICDLNFTITGDYIAITDFIYSMENDDKLNFEIRDFLMEKGGENLQATFIVKDVPINSKNLSTVPTTSGSVYTDIVTEN